MLPQAMRLIIPPTGNLETIPLLITASIWYIIVTSVLTVGQYYFERHYRRSERLAGGRARRIIDLQRRRAVQADGQEGAR